MDEIVKEFLVESYESLDRLERDLVILEKSPHEKETLGSIFRTIHTVKGTSGFLGYGRLEAVAHVGENLLSKLRDGVITFNLELASALLATVDALRCMLAQVEATGDPGERDYRELIELLARLNDGGASVPTPLAPATAPATAVAVPATRCHAAVDPQPVAVVAPASLPSASPVAETAKPYTAVTLLKTIRAAIDEA